RSEGAGRDPVDVEPGERRQVAAGDPPVLPHRRRRPPAAPGRHPVLEQPPERARPRRRLPGPQLDLELGAAPLRLPLPGRPHRPGDVALPPGERVPPDEHPQLPVPGPSLPNASHRREATTARTEDGTEDGTARTRSGPGIGPGPADQVVCPAPPTGFEPVPPP